MFLLLWTWGGDDERTELTSTGDDMGQHADSRRRLQVSIDLIGQVETTFAGLDEDE